MKKCRVTGVKKEEKKRIFDKGAKTIQWKKDSFFKKSCWHNWQLSYRRIRIDPFFLFFYFLLGIFLVYISNATQKSPIPTPHSLTLPTHSPFLALAFPCTGAYKA
jgi:hypothetical protein